MDCRTAQENIGLFVDGMLGEDEARRLQDHMASCPSCLKEMEDLVRVKKALGSLEELEPPAGLAQSAIKKAKKRPWLAYVSAATAAAAAVIALTVLVSTGPLDKTENTSEAAMFAGEAEEAMDMAPAPAEAPLMAQSEPEAKDVSAPCAPEEPEAAAEGGCEETEMPACDGGGVMDTACASSTHACTFGSEKEFSFNKRAAYYKPLLVPYGAELQDITVTEESVAFSYQMSDGTSYQFKWLNSLDTYGLKDYLSRQFGSLADFEFDGRYYTITEQDVTDVYWEQDGIAFYVEAPATFTPEEIETYCLAVLADADEE